ncbi:MAG: hypothetical protein LQ340_005355, partial [Diploschistes diacapsis]
MRTTLVALFSLPYLITASTPNPPPDLNLNANASIADSLLTSSQFSQKIPDHLANFIRSLQSPAENNAADLGRRQQGGVGGGVGVPQATIPTQLSPVTVYSAAG